MKRLAIALIAVLCLLAGIVVASVLWLRTDSGRDWAAGAIAALASTPGETEVAVGGITGDLFGAFGLSDVTVADRRGVWLTIGSAEIDWRPWDLLGGSVTLVKADIGSVAVERLPDSPPSTEEISLSEQLESLRDLPRVRIETLSIEPLALGETVLGQKASLKITGGLSASASESVTGHVEIVRLDGVPGKIAADARFDVAQESLSLNVIAQEPKGGLVARALAVPGFPELKASLKGDGLLGDWKGRLEIAFEQTASAQADLAIRHRDDTVFDISGVATLPDDDADVLRRLASGEHRFRVAGAYGPDDVLSLSKAQLDAAEATVSASGTWNLKDMAVDAKASLKKIGNAPLTLTPADASLATLSADVTATGRLPLPKLKLVFSAGDVAQPDMVSGNVAGTISVDPDGAERGHVTGDVIASSLAWAKQDELAALIGPVVTAGFAADLDLAASSMTAESLNVRTRHAALTGNGQFNWDKGDGTVKASLSAPDLSVLKEIAGTPLAGNLTLAVDAALREFGADASVTINGNAAGFSTGIAVADAVLGRQADLAGTLSVLDDKVAAKEIALTSGRTKLTAAATLDLANETIDGTYKIGIDAGEPVPLAEAVSLQCECGLDGKVAGTFSAVGLTGEVSAKSVTAQEADFDAIKVGYDLANLPKEPNGKITLRSQTPVGDLSARTGLALRDDILKFDGLHAESGDATIDGTVAVPLSGDPIDGDLKFDIRDLKGLFAVARLDGDGTISGTATLRSDGGRQVADAVATVGKLRFRSAPDASIIAVERATLKLSAKDLLAGDRNALDLTVEKASAGDVSLQQIKAHAEGALDRLKLSMQAKGDWRGPLSVDTTAEYAAKEAAPSLEVSKLQGTILGKRLALRKPMRLDWSDAGYAAAPVDLTYGDAKLTGHARSGQKGVDVSIKLAGLPLTTVDPFWPLGIKGDVDATLGVKGAWPNPPGKFTISAPGLKVDQAPDTPALAVDIDGDWKDGRLGVKGNLKAGDAAPSVLTASLPLRLEGPHVFVTVPPEEAVSGRLDWIGEIAALWRFSPLTEHLLRGNGKIDLALSGTAAKPNLQGSLVLDQGYYESLEFGTVLKPLNLTVEFDGQAARITRLDAGDGSGGKVDGKGSFSFDTDAGFPFDLSLKLAALTAVRRDDVQASASGDFSVAGSMKEAKVESKLTTDRVEVRVLDRLPPEVATLDVVEIGRLGKVEKKKDEPSPLADNIELAIDVEMPRRVFVRGRGIDSEWKGNLKVTGPASAPVVAGYVALVRGQLTVVGKTFQMESGTVVLPDRANEEPTLSLVATYSGRNLTVRAQVEGPVSKPTITLSSVPSVPQDEIVSQILFDKSSSKLSAFEAAQLALALAELAGKGGSGGVLDFARKTLGVDVLQIESVDTGDGAKPVVGAGKYITDDVYVGVKQGASPESTSVGVEVEVTPNIFLESDVRRSGESDVGVKFKYDY